MDDAAKSTLGEGSPFSQVPIEITISVGRARPLVRELLRLKRDAVLPLDRKADDPVELYVGDRLIARGELTELDGEGAGQLAVRLTEVADLTNGL
ncbi:Flagellar motor switch protein FliN [Defluviimonas aquaemixtae]|uniref:Flagellar motor switch protein FliN n=1 Tax=Albidovulum aquaemixtae TaxID=1542388 RepID=A0A2R8BJA0_9RHOB|nr:FliM/FliN family flagellar motor switch protein [Defluviimonas aquaemixtae]SPH23427.1 Flagellar motor switch protein FliN [Defluviimonas aquaemixtae]